MQGQHMREWFKEFDKFPVDSNKIYLHGFK